LRLKPLKRWLAVSGVVAFAVTAPAHADCNQFKWNISNELAWFSNNPAPVASGGRIPSFEAGYVVTLAKLNATKFDVQPARMPSADTFAAVLELPTIEKSESFQVTLSDEAWIDIVQNGTSINSTDFSGQKDCSGVRKTVRFRLEKGSATLQLSNASKDSLKVAVRPVE
jgi:hypothetical protein